MNKIASYYQVKRQLFPQLYLSEKISKDLNLEELFYKLNKTSSKIGEQVLYSELHKDTITGLTSSHIKIISEFKEGNFAQDIEKKLKRLSDTSAYRIIELFTTKLPTVSSIHITVISVLRFLPFIFFLLFFVLKWKWSIYLLLLSLIVNTVLHFLSKKDQLISEETITQLPILLKVARDISKWDRCGEINKNINKDLQKLEKIKIPIFFKIDNFFQSELLVIGWWFLEIFKIFFLLEPYLFYSSAKKINTKQKTIENVFYFVGFIDFLLSICKISETEKVCIPSINITNNKLEFYSLVHPLIPSCVPNNLTVKNKSVLLLGSNMSGKSTFLRTVGINVLLAKNLNVCFASSFKMQKYMKISTLMHVNDNLLENKSLFYEEILSIKEMLNNSISSEYIFFIDEIFKGTNTKERIASAKSVLNNLQSRGNIVFASTHDVIIGKLLKNTFSIYHFTDEIKEGKIHFDFLLKKGLITSFNAIKMLEANGYEEKIIEEALEVLGKLEDLY